MWMENYVKYSSNGQLVPDMDVRKSIIKLMEKLIKWISILEYFNYTKKMRSCFFIYNVKISRKLLKAISIYTQDYVVVERKDGIEK